MKLDRTNQLLLGSAVVLLAATGLRIWQDGRPPPPLFVIEPIQAMRVQAIDLTQGERHLRLEHGERWAITEPRALSADEDRLGAFLRDWAAGFTPDLRLLPGDVGLEAWGLDEASRTTLRIEGEGGPIAELYLGARLSGGSHYVGRPRDDGVYRGRVPGSHRLDLDEAKWRDSRLFPFAKDDLASMVIEGANGRLGFRRVETDDRAFWTAADGTDFEPSSRALDGIGRSLCDVKASAILEGAEAEAARPGAALGQSVVTLTTEAGEAWTLRLGGEAEGGIWAAIDGDARLFVVSRAVATQLDKDRSALRDRTVLRFDRSPNARITWRQGEHRLVLAAEGARGWTIAEPPGWGPTDELDLAANSLVNLQALEVLDVPHPAIGDGAVRIDVSDAGQTTTVHLVPDGERWLAFDEQRPATFVLRGAVLERLLRVFGAR